MKRWLSLLLALILAMSLTIPAMAAEELEPPLWQQYGYSSREECITWYFDGDEAAYQEEVETQLERQRWEDTMAEEIAAFDPDAYWDSGECTYSWYYTSKEEFMSDWLLDTEEQFRDVMLSDWLDEQWMAYRRSTLVSRTRAELGGVPGQIGVMLDGVYISFPSAVPEVVEGRTMVPCRPVFEAFGGTVSRDGDDVVCTINGAVYRLRSGGDTISVTLADASTSEIQLGTACYEKNGATYMPLRPFAEAMGCDVLWDSVFQTAAMVRRDALVQEADTSFTVLNRLLSVMERDAAQNYKTAVKLDARLTMLDSINGDQDYQMGAGVDLLQSGDVLNMTARMDLSALLDMEGFADAMSASERAVAKGVLQNMECKLIYDGEAGMMYVALPALSLLSGGAYPDGSWLAIPAAPLDEVAGSGAVTVGALLYENLLAQAEAWGSSDYYYEGMVTPALLCRAMRTSAEEMAAYIGDACFQDSGNYQVFHYGEEEYNAYLDGTYGEGAAEYYSEFEQLELDLRIARSGSSTYRVLIQTKDETYAPAVLVDASGSINAARIDLELLVKLKNQWNLNLRYTADTTTTQENPVTAPPAGATVLDETGQEMPAA